MRPSYQGERLCGAVEIKVIGKPKATGYHHVRSRQSSSSGLMNAFTLWPDVSAKFGGSGAIVPE